MNKNVQKVFFVVLIAIAIGFVFGEYINSSKETKSINETISKEVVLNKNGEGVEFGSGRGQAVYDYELKDMKTGEIVKMSDLRGKKVFLNFWASWCPPCNFEAPRLQSFHENQNDVVVLGVNVGSAEREEGAAQEFIDDFNLTFQNVSMPEDMEKTFIIQSFPTSYLIDESGVIDEIIVGPVTEEIMYELFREIDENKSIN